MRSKRRVIGIIIAVVFVFLMSTFLLSNNLIEAQETKDKQFTSIQVQKGDTLWKIAKKYMGNEYSSVDDYIEEESFIAGILNRWKLELINRLIPANIDRKSVV